MAKKKADDGAATEQPAVAEGGRNVGGRTIAAWKERLRQEYPKAFNSDPRSPAQAERIKAMTDAVNKYAQDGGYVFSADGETVIKWLEQERKKESGDRPARQGRSDQSGLLRVPPTASKDEGEAIAVLRQLVRLLGKDATKRLIDSL